MQITKHQIRKWVFSGAMHPIALIREPLAKRLRERYQEDIEDLGETLPYKYPFPRYLRDAVAATCQDELRGVPGEHYWKLVDQVHLTIFGEHHPSLKLKNLANR